MDKRARTKILTWDVLHVFFILCLIIIFDGFYFSANHAMDASLKTGHTLLSVLFALPQNNPVVQVVPVSFFLCFTQMSNLNKS